MQTMYRLFYRYVNPSTGTPITNDSKYTPTEEFYTTDHKSALTAKTLQEFDKDGYALLQKHNNIDEEEYARKMVNEATKNQEAMITENRSNQDKANNLYVYDGTKKVYHKKFIPEQLGYLVRDWDRVPAAQIPSGPDDYSKDFVIMGGIKLGVDNAFLVCKPERIDNYFKDIVIDPNSKNTQDIITYKGIAINKQNVVIDDIDEIIHQKTYFEWNNNLQEERETYYKESKIIPNQSNKITTDTGDELILINTRTYSDNYSSGTRYYIVFYNNDKTKLSKLSDIDNCITNYTPRHDGSSYTSYTGYSVEALQKMGLTNLRWGNSVTVDKTVLIRYAIPEHYEEIGADPYYIKDTYKKIDLSPWMLHSIHHSLESGLNMARKLVSKVGIENVRLVKNVPVDQFIKIK